MGFLYMNPRLPMLRIQYVDRSNNQRGKQTSTPFGIYSRQSLATDPVGTLDITFSGIKDGSEIKVFDADKLLITGTESSAGIPLVTLSKYAPGSPYNTVRILIINLGYEVIDLTYELPAADATIPVFQRIDRNYRNPN